MLVYLCQTIYPQNREARADPMTLEKRNVTPELRENTTALLGIIGHALDAIIAIDAEHKIILFNHAAELVFGHTAGAMLGQPLDILLPERFRHSHAEQMRIFGRSGTTRRHMGRLGVIWGVRADGTEFPAEAAISRTESDGKLIYSVILRDISEREQIQKELLAQKNLYAMVLQTSKTISGCKDRQSLFKQVCCIAVEHGHFKFASIGWLRSGEDIFDTVAVCGDDGGVLAEHERLPEASIKKSHALKIAAFRKEECAVRNDFLADPAFADWRHLAEKAGTRSSASFALHLGGKIAGMLSVYSDEANFFAESLVTTLKKIANDISYALENLENSETLRNTVENNRLLAEIVRGMDEACFALDKEWRFTFVNDRGTTLLRHSREEMLGKVIWDVFHALRGTPMESNYRRAMAERIPVSFEAFSPIAERWLDIRLFPSGDGLAAFLMDISARKKSEERLREVVENIGEVFWMTNPDKGEILYISPAYDKVWGRKGQDLYENPGGWLAAIHPEDRERIRKSLPAQLRGTYHEEYRIVRPDGSERWISDRAFPIRNPEGKIYHIVGVAEDITAKIQLEMQLRQSQKMEAIGQLSAGVAHDFNNLMTIIQGNNSLVAEEEDPAERQIFIAEINKATEKAAALTRQLLLVGRQEIMNFREIDINDTIKQTLAMLQRIVGEDIDLRFQTPAYPLTVRADTGMITQILLNLTVNSRDAMPKGGQIIIDVSEKNFNEGATDLQPGLKPGAYACISVSDTGPGIPREIQSRVFEPFFTTKDVGKGTGLGLATVFSIVQQHSGWINLYSEPGRGTTFRIHLPMIPGPSVSGTEEEKEEATALPHGEETILIVEDEMPIRKMLRAFLSKLGYSIIEAGTGHEALRVWQENAKKIDLLITDVVMPDGMNGIELARKLQEKKPDLKVIYSSGYSPDLMRSENANLEKRIFVAKPYSLNELAQVVRRCLDQ